MWDSSEGVLLIEFRKISHSRNNEFQQALKMYGYKARKFGNRYGYALNLNCMPFFLKTTSEITKYNSVWITWVFMD